MTVGELIEELLEYLPEEHIVIGGWTDPVSDEGAPMFEIESVYERNSSSPNGLVTTIGIVPGEKVARRLETKARAALVGGKG